MKCFLSAYENNSADFAQANNEDYYAMFESGERTDE